MHVMMAKDQIKDAPDYNAERWTGDTRTQHGAYYSPYSVR